MHIFHATREPRKKGIETVQQSKVKQNANYKYNYMKFDAYSKYEYEMPSTFMHVMVEEGKAKRVSREPSLRAVYVCVQMCACSNC